MKLTETIKELQELAIWMTGCGYDFAKHEYYQSKKHLLQNINIEDNTEFIKEEEFLVKKVLKHKESLLKINNALNKLYKEQEIKINETNR